MSPTERSLKLLRKEGWRVAVVEKWNPHAKVRQDLFGFADLIAISPGGGILLVQVTTSGHMAERRTKIMHCEAAADWKLAGGLIDLHGWKKVKNRYELKREML